MSDQEKISEDVRVLVARGNVTSEDLDGKAFNSWEWEALVGAMADEVFLETVEHARRNAVPKARSGPCLTYDEALAHRYAPEMIKRLRDRRAEIVLLRAALNVDRTGLAVALRKVVEAARGRSWIAEGENGSHEADEDPEDWLRGEIGDALDEVREIATDALRFSGDLVAVLLGSGLLFQGVESPATEHSARRCYVSMNVAPSLPDSTAVAAFDDVESALSEVVRIMKRHSPGFCEGSVYEVPVAGTGIMRRVAEAWWQDGEVRVRNHGTEAVRVRFVAGQP